MKLCKYVSEYEKLVKMKELDVALANERGERDDWYKQSSE